MNSWALRRENNRWINRTNVGNVDLFTDALLVIYLNQKRNFRLFYNNIAVGFVYKRLCALWKLDLRQPQLEVHGMSVEQKKELEKPQVCGGVGSYRIGIRFANIYSQKGPVVSLYIIGHTDLDVYKFMKQFKNMPECRKTEYTVVGTCMEE